MCKRCTASAFQSPHGDSFFSDVNGCDRTKHGHFPFQSPHGDSFFSDLSVRPVPPSPSARFNPLTGIRSFLTYTYPLRKRDRCTRFNPLTGIRSFLTVNQGNFASLAQGLFQSPHGDSFFSDTGDWARAMRGLENVSIPSRGFVLF